ncbi:DUF3886 domain-containing protein [Cohnella endophytica]|uniref:DUF3886 domain-containing protein n=1 Tax=Cohnella endophytica TaxID=2419778 RepID=A0A494Y5S9_9BACL|nr:YqkE family protein [Cohnella endophytica]RKP58037.1 DUF3886 domain-containing protein [Cohnella endophytica]
MANKPKKQQRQAHRSANEQAQTDKPVTLKDLLGASTVAKLKEQAETMKQEEASRLQRARLEAEAARQAEQKLKEKDFEYLLNNSSQDWKKFK